MKKSPWGRGSTGACRKGERMDYTAMLLLIVNKDTNLYSTRVHE